MFHLHRRMKMEQTECSEMLAYKIQTPGNYPEENTQHSKHGESLKSGIIQLFGKKAYGKHSINRGTILI